MADRPVRAVRDMFPTYEATVTQSRRVTPTTRAALRERIQRVGRTLEVRRQRAALGQRASYPSTFPCGNCGAIACQQTETMKVLTAGGAEVSTEQTFYECSSCGAEFILPGQDEMNSQRAEASVSVDPTELE